jgi:hypothetical protein
MRRWLTRRRRRRVFCDPDDPVNAEQQRRARRQTLDGVGSAFDAACCLSSCLPSCALVVGAATLTALWATRRRQPLRLRGTRP